MSTTITRSEATKILGISLTSLMRYIREEGLTAARNPWGRWEIQEVDLVAWVAARRTAQRDHAPATERVTVDASEIDAILSRRAQALPRTNRDLKGRPGSASRAITAEHRS